MISYQCFIQLSVIRRLIWEADPCKMETILKCPHHATTFIQKGIKGTISTEDTDAALRANVCTKCIVSEPFMDRKKNAFTLELMPYDYL